MIRVIRVPLKRSAVSGLSRGVYDEGSAACPEEFTTRDRQLDNWQLDKRTWNSGTIDQTK
jgi:hypothetical protein